MQIVRVKRSTKRQKPLTIITLEQFKALVRELKNPVRLTVFIVGALGLRISEGLALK
jgi:hypothetical protein